MLVSGRYGYFVDELYYLACSHHLAWGYVDQPPLIAVITWLERVTLGDSLSALHFLPAVAAGFTRVADRIDRARTGCAAIWDCARLRMRGGGADLSGARFAAYDECVRVAVLDGRGAGGAEDFQWGEPKAVDTVWRDLRHRTAE